MCKTAEQIILVVDSSKFNRKAFSKVCSLEDITTIITDDNLTDDINKSYVEHVDILLAKLV